MKKLIVLVLALISSLAMAQQTNPQTNFPATVTAANPSLWLNFNDLTTNFTDSVSGSTFSYNPHSTVTAPSSISVPSGSSSPGYITIPTTPLTPGVLSSVIVQMYSVPAAGQAVTILIASGTAPSLTIVNSFTVNVAATTAPQTFATSAVTITSNEYIGYWVPTSGGKGIGSIGAGSNYYLAASSSLPSGAHTYGSGTGSVSLQAVITMPAGSVPVGTVTARQAGFDSTTPNNTSASFTYNAWSQAPNNTLGAIDWNVPFSILVHVDRLNWNRTGSLVLMSKGNLGLTPSWQLVLQMVGQTSQLCFYEYGVSQPQGACTGSSGDAMPNGFNYDIVVTNDGTGANGATGGGSSPANVNAVSLYINGLSEGTVVAPYGLGFGALSFTVSGGTGYAASTPVTITGGGPNCTLINYTMTASGGVPSGISGASAAPNYGCTSAPTVSLTSPAGSGVTITATPNASYQTMNAAYPLMVPGYINSNVAYGIAGTNTTASPIYVDEAPSFPAC